MEQNQSRIEKKVEDCYGVDCEKCEERCLLYDCGMDVLREKKECLAIANGSHPVITFNEAIESKHVEEQSDIFPIILRKLKIDVPKSNFFHRSVVEKILREVISRMVYFQMESPYVYQALLKSVYYGYNQSDLAREKGITRAAVSKRLREGVSNMITHALGMRTPVAKRDKLLGLSLREFEVYKLLFVDGVSERSAAKILGISDTTIHRMKHFLRVKLSKKEAPKKPPGKIFKKS